MQIFKKFCRKSESSLSLSNENAVINGTNLRPIKAMRCDERFVSLALKKILLETQAHYALTHRNTHA